MKRDSQLWWWAMAAGVLGVFSAHFDLLSLCCELGDRAKALIELASVLVATLSGVMRASPLHDISDEGRAAFKAAKARSDEKRNGD